MVYPQGAAYPTVSLCSQCGVVAPKAATVCSLCQRPFDVPRTSIPAVDEWLWVAMRCTFPCRACGFPSPLEGVELDVGVNCAQCGAFQRFDKAKWAAVLEFSHEVADLAGPNPEGRFPNPRLWIGEDNPYRAVGSTKTWAEKDFRAIRIEAAPGYPVCSGCRVPVEARPDGAAVVTRCPRCGGQARYELAAEARGFSPALRAVVAPRQRTDRGVVRVEQTQAGLVALQCPQCGAAVGPARGDTVECTYCKAVSLLPARARPRTQGEIVQAPVFWACFQGPSDKRGELEQPKPPDAGKSAKAAAKKAASVFARGLAPLPGIELAEMRRGIDLRQLALTVGLTTVALAIAAALVAAKVVP